MTALSSGLDLTVVLGARPAQAPARTRLGKPYLPGTAGFGLSDSGGVQAAPYANRKYVGIDIERLDRPDLAARRHRLGAWVARRDHVPVEFLAGWVAREACAKCVGLGLLHALPRMAIAWTRQVAEGRGRGHRAGLRRPALRSALHPAGRPDAGAVLSRGLRSA